MKSSSTLSVIATAVLCLFTCSCRENIDDDLRLSPQSLVWYDSLGAEGECEDPPASCDYSVDHREFSKACVDRGHKAKTCGCTVKCSGRFEWGDIRKTAPAGVALKGESPVCDGDSKEEISGLAAHAETDDRLRDCIYWMLCNGARRNCNEAQFTSANRLRILARGQCRSEVVGRFCFGGFKESLSCDDGSIEYLSVQWRENILERGVGEDLCYRQIVCGLPMKNCKPALIDKVKGVKDRIQGAGCEYWFEHFCRL